MIGGRFFLIGFLAKRVSIDKMCNLRERHKSRGNAILVNNLL